MDRNQILSRRTIEGRIADGQVIVITEGNVLRLDGWLEKHPGGHLAILHMVGRDASDEINVYHSAETLRLMKAYRIGRITQPWINFEPPIRGGVYRKPVEEDADGAVSSEDDDLSVASNSILGSFNSSSTSLNLLDASQLECSKAGSDAAKNRVSEDKTGNNGREREVGSDSDSDTYRRRPFQAGDDIQAAYSPSPSPIMSGLHTPVDLIASELALNEVGHGSATRKSSHPAIAVSPAPYASADIYSSIAIQKEIDDDTRNYPSVDLETQRTITLKYQALHQRVKNEGFYDCRYTEYAKELIRYSILFAIFFTALRYEWYLTSAAFLGLFWVSQWPEQHWVKTAADDCSIKLCLPLTTQVIEVSPTTSSLIP
ncbi:MAG: hypothetical protein Q9187_007906 [Circinaria calcarea]